MATKKKSGAKKKAGARKAGKLTLHKETIKDLQALVSRATRAQSKDVCIA